MMHDDPSEALKLLALDDEDLTVVSAHLQDAVGRVADMAYLPAENRFVAILNRFDWLHAATAADNEEHRRARCALRFDRVKRAQVNKLNLGQGTASIELLALTYEATDAPSGFITLMFAGGGAVRLEVECIEGELRDLGAVWQTAVKPEHEVV